jgi:hypothetical protein
MNKIKRKGEKKQEAEVMSERCWLYLRDLLKELNHDLDRRLVKTLLDMVQVILIHRHRNNGLLLSELGDHLLGGERGPAGVKRIAKLLQSQRWNSQIITEYLWKQGDQGVRRRLAEGERVYVIWDESVIEKSESLKAEGLCAVRSSKAARLKRIKPGYFNPPGGRPIFVPGMNWLQVLVAGPSGVTSLAHLRWWTTRGEKESDKRSEEGQVLKRTVKMWGRKVIHIWDRGFAGSPWTSLALQKHVRFILRWKKDYNLLRADGLPHKAWQITRGQRSWEHRLIWDARRRCYRKTGVIAVPVSLPDYPRRLWLVVSRPGSGRKPWYLLTTERIRSAQDAWSIIFAYARRWQVEMSIRFTKSEMAFECPRLHKWEARLKFLLIASLAYAFLLSLLAFPCPLLRLFDLACHRTGKWSRDISAPLYRLRLALSRLWLAYRPTSLPSLDSG